MKEVDVYINSAALIIYVIFFAILLIIRKGRIDNSAKIICIVYPFGIAAQIYWRSKEFGINAVLEAFIILIHDIVVMSPSYFVFEMESIRCITTSTTLEHFQKSRWNLKVQSSIIAGIFVSFSLASAFLNSFTEQDLNQDSSSTQKVLYLFGAVLQTLFFFPAIYVCYIYLISLTYFVRCKLNAVLDRQFDLSIKHRFLVIWSYMIGFLQLSTLLVRIFLTIYTRFWLNPERDTRTIEVEACRLWITIVDWVTPFSLLYLYKHISLKKNVHQKKKIVEK